MKMASSCIRVRIADHPLVHPESGASRSLSFADVQLCRVPDLGETE